MTIEQKSELPSGYIWKNLAGTTAKFPMPDTWFFLAHQAEDIKAFFLTRESIVDEGICRTGLSINITPNIRNKYGRSAIELARRLMDTLPVVPTSGIARLEDGPLTIYRRYFILPRSMKVHIPRFGGGTVEKITEPTNFYVQTVANKDTDTAYIMQFETPSRLWNVDRLKAKVMIENGVLDKTV